MKSQASVTFCMISLNDETIIEDCLKSIRLQDFDQDKIDILLVDGGSTDQTLSIANKYNANVIYRPDLKEKPSIRGGIALRTPRTDYIVFFSADNRLVENDIVSLMVSSFDDEKVFGCHTMYYGSNANDPIISRYFALMGGADPIAISLKKADRAPLDFNGWHLRAPYMEYPDHFTAIFSDNLNEIPTLGANGFMMRRSLIDITTVSDNAAHTDMCVEIIKAGYNKCAFIKNRSVNHFINVGLINFIKRRLSFASQYSPENIKRIYGVFQKEDTLNLIYIIISSLCIVPTLWRAYRGYTIKRDFAWFLHPLIINLFIVSYGIYFTKRYIYEKFRSY